MSSSLMAAAGRRGADCRCRCSAAADEMTLAAGAGYPPPDRAKSRRPTRAASGDKVLQIYGHIGQVFAQARESGRDRWCAATGRRWRRRQACQFAPHGPARPRQAGDRLSQGTGAERSRRTSPRPNSSASAFPIRRSAIYGKAGRQFLERSGLAAAVDARLVAVATVPQVTSYVASGEVDAGFVNATDAIGAAANIGGYVEVGAELYDPVEIVCAILSLGRDTAAAARTSPASSTPSRPARSCSATASDVTLDAVWEALGDPALVYPAALSLKIAAATLVAAFHPRHRARMGAGPAAMAGPDAARHRRHPAAGVSADRARLLPAAAARTAQRDRAAGWTPASGSAFVFSVEGVLLASVIAGLPLVVKPIEAAIASRLAQPRRGVAHARPHGVGDVRPRRPAEHPRRHRRRPGARTGAFASARSASR